MNSLHQRHLALALLAPILLVIRSDDRCAAAPITYLYEGRGSGSVGTATFADSAFTIAALADTNNVAFWADGGNAIQNTHLSASIVIAGLGQFTILTPSHTWGANEYFGSDQVGVGRNLSGNWVTVAERELSGYDLASPVGPILETDPLDVNQFVGVETTGGTLNFTEVSEIVFTAAVPEPVSRSLAAMSLLAIVHTRSPIRRRPRTSNGRARN